MMSSTDLPQDSCPLCGQVVDAARCLQDDSSPSPGDITICFYCQGLLAFTEDMRHRVLTDGEWLALPADYRAFLTRMRDEMKRFQETSR